VSVAPKALTPARYARPWGGTRFGTIGDEPVGELWVSGDDATLPDGRTLGDAGLAGSVPLVKVLDVASQLSVQVHPDDPIAREIHGPVAVGKHEAWVVLDAAAGASLFLGLADPGRLEDLFSGDRERVVGALRLYAATSRMVVDVEPGTVHAPGAGVLLYEIQQRSDLTYRIFDWGRSRPVHLAEARRAIRAEATARISRLPERDGSIDLVHGAAPFRLQSVQPGEEDLEIRLDRPAVLSVIGGDVDVGGVTLANGGHWLIGPGQVSVSGRGTALLASWR
jgi:mannose-6-phosphate isomerase